MGTKMMRVCDVCDAPADGDPITFGWGSGFYETDLCAEHGGDLVDLMERVVKTARRRGGSPSRPAPVTSPFVAPEPKRAHRVDTAEVRVWAKKKGIKVSDKGRLPDEVIEKFLASAR